ncbi:IS21 family transposase [Kibdelosporangium philippinense]|uniref:IS21 family transposase n=1 Tax=Kibdelosporangium philippinense TaxID=211113 RepID=A0ABS8Z213_9PSEU|nr:IS21 family transposase [Kibdelosporangium philippinense]MCE7001984.1 IS21 family transposase [Kibdelosporangium philippinense]MCE7002179.1 IS21 family transposase [Kibdelosporangium philippinense]MCE7002439.1 IS21 family transposase [Kibdelosporangium philippinense]MCE7003007.1 IS21 family transposase [Kibdelosporangium philippinense]MCE7004525.1 IS21 family transposase [Kibdelosporangium philippinense]
MILDEERWAELRRFRGLYESGAMSISAIARETGLHRQTVRKYLASDARPGPPRGSSRKGTRTPVIAAMAPVIDAWLRSELLLKGTVIHERLVEQYGFTGNYQRVKLYLQEARPRIAAELGIAPDELGLLHRRFEVIPGAQAQVDWGDEGQILAHVGIPKVYSFHMTLSYSRDPFCCFTTSQDLETFFACHRRAFEHFGGVPRAIVYDRTKTVVRRHVAPGKAVPLHPEAVAFAGHYDFDIDVLAAYRPTGKGRVERQVAIVRDHVLAGRGFASLEEMDSAFTAWVPLRRKRVHSTHGEVIGHRAARDHSALHPIPVSPYLVTQRHLRHVGKDCLVAFDASLYSVPARKVRHRQLVEIRATADTISLHATSIDAATTGNLADGTLLAVHPRATTRGQRVVDETHWDGLPDGHTRAVTTSIEDDDHDGKVIPLRPNTAPEQSWPRSLEALLTRTAAAQIKVEHRPLSVYEQLTGTGPSRTTALPQTKDHR